MGRLRKLTKRTRTGGLRWNNLPWKAVDLSSTDLGEYDDAVFFGLEEIDGAEYQKYVKDNTEIPNESTEDSKPLKRKKSSEKKEIVRVRQSFANSEATPLVDNTDLLWDHSISLHNQIVSSLKSLGFNSPTPIQAISIPMILAGHSDVVGSAETGSGKTLAFGLPILHSLLNNWDSLDKQERHSPYALILAPTRELAVQISSVMNDVCKSISQRKIQIVNIIGGMSEQKQRRLLSNQFRPVHILVSTPGRLCDLISDVELTVLQDLSKLRYLVVDEADRMVEDGHFPELFKIFNQIRRHEKIASLGKDPVHGSKFSVNDSADHVNEIQTDFSVPDIEEIGLGDNIDFQFDAMPSEESIVTARLEMPPLPEEDRKVTSSTYIPNMRQTLLFSATALTLSKEEVDSKRRRKQLKKEQSIAGRKRVEYLRSLGIPEHLRQLLETVGIQEATEIAIASPLKLKSDINEVPISAQKELTENDDSPSSLPPGLKQLEIRVPIEEKDLIAYFFLLKHPGRTVIFVNSIKTARRLDGLLRALDINSRTIHAQLQQKQRLKALDSFRSTPIGVLVATDVAARGLDLPRIQYVLHYDIARSPQLYIHRSGRTARAGASGTSLSIVAPEDGVHHEQICSFLNVPSLPLLRLDLTSAPSLFERVRLAKKIFLQSFVMSQTNKQFSWLEQSAKDADLVVDENMFAEIEEDLSGKGKKKVISNKGSIEKDRMRLKQLLNEPWDLSQSTNPFQGNSTSSFRSKRPFIVVAK